MNISGLFRRKSIDQIQADAASGLGDHDQPGQLRRTLGVFDLTLMGIAAIVGAGIFAMVGKASFDGGPAVIFLFLLTALACGFSALCYAEFASRIPVAGSAYTYSYASLGELIAWIIGWDLIVEYAIGNIAVAISWSDYFTRLLSSIRAPWLGIDKGINIPLNFTMDFLTANRGFDAVQEVLTKSHQTIDQLQKACDAATTTAGCGGIEGYLAWTTAPKLAGLPIICDLPALGIVFVITALVYIGIRESKWAGNSMTILKLGIILLVIFLGAFYVDPKNWYPFNPNGVTGVLKGVSAVFFAYIGFDALSTTAEECKDPRRDLPRSMIASLIICTILYCALALVLTGMVSYTKLNVGDPLAFVFTQPASNLPWVAGIIAVSAVIALATVFLVFQIGQPRLWMAMSRDGLLPKIFSSIHPKFRTPWFATLVTGVVVAVPALFMNLTEVTDLASIGTLFAFVLVCAGVLFKDKEFGREKRFVPYISSEYLVPALILAVFALIAYFYPEGIQNFFKLIPAEAGDSAWTTFSHKIPMIVFILLCIVIIILSVLKKLSAIPVVGLLLCTYLMTELGTTNWMRFGIWLLVGIRIYRFFGYRNSNLNPEKIMPSGMGLLKLASMIADFVLLGIIIFPLVGYFAGISNESGTMGWIYLIAAAAIAIILEVLTQMREKTTPVAA
jgi:APA family basic amino acid/polyamine antiporter